MLNSSAQWTDNNGTVQTLNNATAVTFSPDTNNFLVSSGIGDFADLAGLTGTILDFVFSGAAGSIPAPVIPGWETVGDLTVDLTEVTSFFTVCPAGCTVSGGPDNVALNIFGKVLFHRDGFDDTPGTFQFTTQGQTTQANFSFSATETATPSRVPEPTTLLLLGGGLVAVGSAARARRR